MGALDSKEARRLFEDVSLTTYSPPGFLLFVRDAALMAQAFDARRLAPTGEPEILAQPAWSDALSAWGRTGLSVRPDALAYRDGRPEKRRLTWLDREGRVTGTVGDDAAYSDLALSPDGRRLALSIVGKHGPSALWLRDMERDSVSRLSPDSSGNYQPVWSPTGDRIVFYSTRTGTDSLFVQAANGTASPELIIEAETVTPYDWSPDGRLLLVGLVGAGTRTDLLTIPVSGEGKPETFLAAPFNESQGRFSPDGRFVAYSSDETGRLEVYGRAFPTGTERFQASATGGSFPAWRRDGRELYYLSARGEMMAVGVEAARSGLVFGSP
ncbi:MAG: TolB family protein, partial [Vicinamibacteria bacterium]